MTKVIKNTFLIETAEIQKSFSISRFLMNSFLHSPLIFSFEICHIFLSTIYYSWPLERESFKRPLHFQFTVVIANVRGWMALWVISLPPYNEFITEWDRNWKMNWENYHFLNYNWWLNEAFSWVFFIYKLKQDEYLIWTKKTNFEQKSWIFKPKGQILQKTVKFSYFE